MFVAVDFLIDLCNNFKQGKQGTSLTLPHLHDFKVLKSVAQLICKGMNQLLNAYFASCLLFICSYSFSVGTIIITFLEKTIRH